MLFLIKSAPSLSEEENTSLDYIVAFTFLFLLVNFLLPSYIGE